MKHIYFKIYLITNNIFFTEKYLITVSTTYRGLNIRVFMENCLQNHRNGKIIDGGAHAGCDAYAAAGPTRF